MLSWSYHCPCVTHLDIQRVDDAPMHSTPYPDPPTLSARPGPVLLPPRPRSTSVPPMSITVQRMVKRYMPVTETVTPPISPARASTKDPQTDPDTPPPTQHPGRSRGRGKWRAPQKVTPGVGTRSKTRQAETRRSRSHAGAGLARRVARKSRQHSSDPAHDARSPDQ